ncbi:hypothetical protein MCOR25_004517 [Pyricularia grisea]|uniref:Rhodopsin domain-containing protein n=1 Tax=Pyricularia grisea TaxID=148305 RepID=A0A6P8B2V6_PYRGI|nr:uncharacterized protein PgNI_06965 [Pyricularia grisea]KAI6369164.1 hypothetical protein MCOR25_004517 [Pyricularia grisea]TLD09245.1 hypothetical protein PgNI_06965 [Pyricularia grisea]
MPSYLLPRDDPSSQPTVLLKESPGYNGRTTLILNSIIIVLTTVVVMARLFVRAFMTKALGLDDLMCFLAFCFVITLSSMELHSVEYGSGAHLTYVPQELLVVWFESLVTQTLIYFIATGFMRLSILTFLPRLNKDLRERKFMIAIWATGFVIVAQTIGCFVYRLTECSPISDTWKPLYLTAGNCVSAQEENSMMVGHQSIGLAIDVALLALPIWIIYDKMLFSKRALQVILIFGIGIFVVVAGIVRLYMLKTLLFLEDPTYNISTLGVWTDLEGHIGLWCGCFPAMQPLLRLFSYKLGLRSKLKSYVPPEIGHESKNPAGSGALNNTIGSNGAAGGSGWSSGASRCKKTGYIKSGSGADADSNSEQCIVGPDVELDNIEQAGTNDHGIRKTTNVEVSVDECGSPSRFAKIHGW